jgi:LysR family transcriptional regulator, regulator for bpeEF and oprC
MVNLNGITAFVRAAEHGSFAAAATALGLTPSAVSKSISTLELSLRTRLLSRTPLGVSLTDDGKRFYQRCLSILNELTAAEREVSSARTYARGRLRVALHVGLAHARILHGLPVFLARHPELELEVLLSPGSKSLGADRVDVGVFIGEPVETGLVARPVAQLNMITCASPLYLERHGVPAAPGDLANHNCLVYLRPNGKPYDEWEFRRGDAASVVKVRGNLCANEGPALMDAAAQGVGIARIFNIQPLLTTEAGPLKPLLTDWLGTGPPVYVMYLAGGRAPAKVRAFVDFVAALFDDVRPATHARVGRQKGEKWPMLRT